MKRLLMICYPFPPNASAGAVRSERIARYLAWLGWDVEVITIRQREDLYNETAQLEKLPNGVRVHQTRVVDPWLWLNERSASTQVGRFVKDALMEVTAFPDHTLYWNPVAVAKGLEIHRKRPVDVIYTTSPPHATQLCGLNLARLVRRPWVADFRDPWTLNAYRQKGLIRSILNRIEKFLETRVLRRADMILANTTANRENLLRAFPFLLESDVVYLPNGWEEFPKPLQPVNRQSAFTVVHAGNFYPRFKPYALLHALAHWRRNGGEAGCPPFQGQLKILILGARDAVTQQLVERLDLLDIVEIRPWLALDETREIMMRADLLWTSLGTGPESRTYIPSKIFEYISARRPILGFFPEGEAERLICRTNCGKVFTNDDPLPIIDFISDCIARRSRGEPIPYRPVAPEVAVLGVRHLISQLDTAMTGIIGSGRR